MRLLLSFLLQWIVTSFGLWLAVRLLGTTDAISDSDIEMNFFFVAGFILSLINIFIKPIVSIISIPITILTLGLFTLVINGLMVYLALQWTNSIEITFFDAIIAGIIIGIVNFVINQAISAVKAAK